MMDELDECLVTVPELCDILMISRGQAYQLLKSGKLKCFRMGRIWKIPKQSVREFINMQAKNRGL